MKNAANLTIEHPPAPQPATDDEARMRVFQIIGSDIYPDAPSAFTGNWHQALQKTCAHWDPTHTDHAPAA